MTLLRRRWLSENNRRPPQQPKPDRWPHPNHSSSLPKHSSRAQPAAPPCCVRLHRDTDSLLSVFIPTSGCCQLPAKPSRRLMRGSGLLRPITARLPADSKTPNRQAKGLHNIHLASGRQIVIFIFSSIPNTFVIAQLYMEPRPAFSASFDRASPVYVGPRPAKALRWIESVEADESACL